MKVRVDGRYTYETDLPVQVGDRVELPPSWVSTDGWQGTVTALNDDGGYQGECKQIVRIIKDHDVYRGYAISDSGVGYLLIRKEDSYDYVQEPFKTFELAKAAIDRHLDLGVPFHQGS